MIKPNEDIAEIADFLRNLALPAPFFVASDPVVACYKKFLAVLLQRHGAHKTALIDEAKVFLDETTSDLSYSLYLNALGFYKPSRLSLRGAIENVLRFALAQAEVDPKPLGVSQMFDAAKADGRYYPVLSSIALLKQSYVKLCKSSHTIDIQFMAHNIPFSELVEQDKSKFDSNLTDFAKVSGAIGSLIYVASSEAVAKLSPEQQDFVRSQVPMTIKKALLNS